MRKKIVAGNWKMHCTLGETRELIKNLLQGLKTDLSVEVVVCPPFTALSTAVALLHGTAIKVGAQDVFWKERGAYTGQISPSMLVDVGCSYVIVGHSERRGRFGVPEPDMDAALLAHFGDNDRTVNYKLRAALQAGLIPICCVGETLEERQAGRTDVVVTNQTRAALQGVGAEEAAKLVFAYEPVWAIGTGEVCAAAEANRVCGLVRAAVLESLEPQAAARVRVQYGGSVKPDNAAELLSQPEIDGALVGGASLKAADFLAILATANSR